MAQQKSPNDNFDVSTMTTILSGQEPTENEKKLLQQIAALQAQLKAAQSQPSYNPSIESSSTRSLYEMLEQYLHSLIEHWNKVNCDESHDAEENQITRDVPTYILGSPNTADLDTRFPDSIVIRSS